MRLTPRPPGLHVFLAFLFTALLFLSQSSDGTRVVFDDIGEMAGAVSYTHVFLPIDLRVTAENAIKLREDLDQRLATLVTRIGTDATSITDANDLAQLRVVVAQLTDLDDVFDRLVSIRQYFPADFDKLELPFRFNGTFDYDAFVKELDTDRSSVRPLPRDRYVHLQYFKVNPDGRNKRLVQFIPFIVGAAKVTTSIFSTINGLYTRKQLKVLRLEVNGLKTNVRSVVKLTTANTVAITLVHNKLKEVENEVVNALMNNPAIHQAEVDRIIKGLHRSIDLLIQIVQEASHNKLATGFLTPEVLESTFKRVESAAKLQHCDLVLEQPADLALTEVSFISDENGATLILHVPMIPQGTLLHLLRLHPFPIPLGNFSLVPEVNVDVIGISESGHSAEIRYSDLVDCHKIGRTYYCEKQNILTDKGTPSCLRALHDKDFDGALQLCELKVRPSAEAAIRLDPTHYLIFSPASISASRTCHAGGSSSSNTVDVPKGISTLEVPPGCILKLRHHEIYADSSVTVADNHFSYTWDWEVTVLRLDQHAGHLAKLAEDLAHHSGPVHLHDVLERSERLHRESMEQTELNRTLSNTTLEARRERQLNQTLSVVGMFFAGFAIIGLVFGALHFRLKLLSYARAIRYVFRQAPDVTKWFRPTEPSITENNNTPATRLYPDLNTERWTELANFSRLLQQQALRLRTPRPSPAIDV